MAGVSRRGFLQTSVATAAGVAGMGALASASVITEAADMGGVGAVSSDAVVAHVRNAATGEVAVWTGERELVIHDRVLVKRLLRAAL